MLTCKQASKLVSQSLDRRLTWVEVLQLKLHLLICRACQQFNRQLHLLRLAFSHKVKHIEDDHTIHLPLEAKARIKLELKKASKDSPN